MSSTEGELQHVCKACRSGQSIHCRTKSNDFHKFETFALEYSSVQTSPPTAKMQAVVDDATYLSCTEGLVCDSARCNITMLAVFG